MICALKGSREPGVRNVSKTTTEMIAVTITFFIIINCLLSIVFVIMDKFKIIKLVFKLIN